MRFLIIIYSSIHLKYGFLAIEIEGSDKTRLDHIFAHLKVFNLENHGLSMQIKPN